MDPDNKFLDFVKNHIHHSKEEIEDILVKVGNILEKEQKLVQIPSGRIFILGDTHGNIDMTLHALKHVFPPETEKNNRQIPENATKNGKIFKRHHTKFDKIVFLGDFIDRGPYSVENINLLISLKAAYPEKVILIRGNHETREINKRFDFYEKVIRRYDIGTFEKYNQVFSKLPLAILTWNNIFGVHGGIPEGLERLKELDGLNDEVNPENTITFQLLWNDPVEKDGWFFRNFRGKYSKKFGRKAFQHFVRKNNIKLVLRAHQTHRKGFKHFFGSKHPKHKKKAPRLISIDSHSSKWRKPTQKVFIIEKSGKYKISQVEFFQKKMFSDL